MNPIMIITTVTFTPEVIPLYTNYHHNVILLASLKENDIRVSTSGLQLIKVYMHHHVTA